MQGAQEGGGLFIALPAGRSSAVAGLWCADLCLQQDVAFWLLPCACGLLRQGYQPAGSATQASFIRFWQGNYGVAYSMVYI